jgi:hypothetical protein
MPLYSVSDARGSCSGGENLLIAPIINAERLILCRSHPLHEHYRLYELEGAYAQWLWHLGERLGALKMSMVRAACSCAQEADN